MPGAFSKRVRPWAVIEVDGGSDERECTELIRAAYRSSASGVVALVLRGVTRQVADRALDPVVGARTEGLQGVVYLDAGDSNPDVLSAAARASLVVASTESFRLELMRNGIESLDVHAAYDVLTPRQ